MKEMTLMKTLTKIKLINWHGFYDETINIQGSTLITGDNGCGKSTLLDAIYFLLSGGEDNKFNAAANENANRNLTTYMRGKTGTEGKEFLRPESNIISHIALEFYDNVSKQYFVVGVVLEIQDSKPKVGRSFYHIPNYMLTDDIFFNETDSSRNILNFRALEKRLGRDRVNSLDFPTDSRDNIRKNLYSILELDKKKYYELLPKAIAFKPIPDVSDFVYKFLLPENEVNIESIRATIHTYNELQAKIKDETAKKETLEKIVELGDKYKKISEEIEILQGYKIQKQYVNYKNKLDKAQESQRRIQMELESIDNKIDEYKKEISRIEKIIWELEHNAAMEALRKVEEDLDAEQAKERTLKEEEAKLNNWILSEIDIAELLQIKVKFQNYIKGRDFPSLITAIELYKKEYDEKLLLIHDSISDYKGKIEQLTGEKTELLKEQGKLEKGLPSYNHAVSSLIEVIESGIYDSTGEKIRAIPLCELIDVAEGQEAWRNALEGYLNTRRFDLFVPEKYYDKALNLYEKYKFEKGISGVGLVNVAKIKEQPCASDSLAAKILTENSNALKYVNFLMGDVICVENENELKKYERSITKTVMVYQNKASRQTKKEVYATPYIGTEALRIRLKTVTEKLKGVEDELRAALVGKTEQEALRRRVIQSSYKSIIDSKDVWTLHDQAKIMIASLKYQLNEIKKSTNSLIPKLEGHRAFKQDFEDKKMEAEARKETLLEERANAKRDEKDELEKIQQLESIVEVLNSNLVLLKKVNEFATTHALSIKESEDAIQNINKEIEKIKSKLPSLMGAYIERFSFDATAEIDSLNSFYQEYNQVVSRDLSKHLDRLQEVKQEAVIAFQNSYIAEIRRHIIDEKRNIEKLNDILKNKPFGADGEVYRFKIDKSADKSFGDYYDVFMSNQDYQAVDLFTAQLSDKNYNLMQDLFAQLTKEDTEGEYIRKYTDYRKFMSYDIQITNKRGEVSCFSKINKEKSGGETQTPFYVIIAASFDQLMQQSYGRKSPGCIVMLDEAFNNMDEAHIDSMMQYFSSLNIQPIIVVPTQRAKTIMPYVSTTIALVKKRNRMLPKSVYKEEL